MSNLKVAFHAMFPAGLYEDAVAAALDAAGAAVGLSFAGIDQDRRGEGATRNYVEPGVEPLGFSYTLRPPCQAYVSTGYYRPGLEPYAPPRVAEAFTRICAGLDADLGRSDLGGGYGFVNEREIDGPLEFIDWYQYLGPRMVERMGRERLLRVPAFRITELDRGAIVMMLAEGPWVEDWSRAKVAEHLGFTLRPLESRNPRTGEPIYIKWP